MRVRPYIKEASERLLVDPVRRFINQVGSVLAALLAALLPERTLSEPPRRPDDSSQADRKTSP